MDRSESSRPGNEGLRKKGGSKARTIPRVNIVWKKKNIQLLRMNVPIAPTSEKKIEIFLGGGHPFENEKSNFDLFFVV